MPQNKIDYSKTIIYKLCCKDLDIKEIYVGHTTDMRKRKSQHKYDCNNEKHRNYNIYVYQFIRANGGFENFDMIEIERYNAIDGNDVRKRERYWVDELKAILNSQLPTRNRKEWEKDNFEHHKEYKKQYREINKQIIVEKNKEYYSHNKEIINKKKIEYYNKNKEVINENKKEKISCECGCVCRKDVLAKHQQTQKHINLMSQLS
jgi:hypothetical protein